MLLIEWICGTGGIEYAVSCLAAAVAWWDRVACATSPKPSDATAMAPLLPTKPHLRKMPRFVSVQIRAMHRPMAV